MRARPWAAWSTISRPAGGHFRDVNQVERLRGHARVTWWWRYARRQEPWLAAIVKWLDTRIPVSRRVASGRQHRGHVAQDMMARGVGRNGRAAYQRIGSLWWRYEDGRVVGLGRPLNAIEHRVGAESRPLRQKASRQARYEGDRGDGVHGRSHSCHGGGSG